MYEEISRNKRRTALLIAGFVLVVVGIGYVFGMLTGYHWYGLTIAAVIAIVMTWISYFSGDKIVLRVTRAKQITPEQEPRLHNIVDGLIIAAGMPKPKLYVIEDAAPNAFATGRDPKHASVAVTRGLLDRMNRVELEGVVAHELAHVQNRDILVMAIAATLVGIVVLIADWTMRSFFWGVGGRKRGSRDGGAAGIFVLVGLVFAILMPIVAQVLHFSISRRREYYADISGVRMTRYPPGLVAALEKLREDQTVVRTASRATAHLWIESPLDRQSGKLSWLNRLFNTHPPLDDRIRILREL